jgi:hypothetical protein
MKMEWTECSEMSAHKIQTPGNNPEENIKQDIINFPFIVNLNFSQLNAAS